MPDEVRRLKKDKAILLVRGAKPLLLSKITPEEHPSFKKLKYCKSTEYVPAWRKKTAVKQSGEDVTDESENGTKKAKKGKKEKMPEYQVQIPIADKVSEEYIPDEEETNLKPTIDISTKVVCRTLGEVETKEV